MYSGNTLKQKGEGTTTMKKHLTKKANASLSTGIVLGTGAAILISILLTAVLTSIVLNGRIGESGVNNYVFVIRAVSVLVGCMISTILINNKHLLVIGLTALGYLIIIIGWAIVLYNGSFHSFASGLVSVLLGAVGASIIKLKPPKKSTHKLKQRK